MGLALGALAGILSGLGGVPKGMAEGTAADQRQQQIDEQVRHRQMLEQQSQTDLGQLSQMLGIDLPGVQPGMRVPNTTATMVAGKGLADQTRQRDQARMDALRMQLPEAVRPYFGVTGGADLYKAANPADAAKPSAPHYQTDAEGNVVAMQVGPGGVTTHQTGVRAAPKEVPQSRQVSEGALADKGWTPDMPGYREALYQLMTPMTPIAEGGAAVPRTFSVPAPPARGPGSDPGVQAAGRDMSTAVAAHLAEATNGLPGVPPVTAPQPAGGPTRMPGGGVQGPPRQQALPAGQVEQLADMRNFIGMLNEAERIYNPEFSGPVRGRVGALGNMIGVGPGSSPEESDLRALLASFGNQLLRLRSGQAVTPGEAARIQQELPTINDPPTVFTAKLQRARQTIQQAISAREAEFSSRGFRGGEPQAPAPTQAPAPPQAQGKVRVIAPDGTPGTWDLSKGPIPPGFKQRP